MMYQTMITGSSLSSTFRAQLRPLARVIIDIGWISAMLRSMIAWSG
jgi:hypothetical protein